MIKIENFNNSLASEVSYGGHSGSKKGIIFNNENWLLKYPKSTRSMDVQGLSYTTSPLSEYLGSKIYESIGIETHEVKLGIANEKVVVACKDFLKDDEIILDYNAIKNDFDENVEKAVEELISSGSLSTTDDLCETILIMNENKYFKKNPELKNRFWDMFIIDAFISNNDRNEGNWGLILNKKTKEIRIAPVYDNGAAFYNKISDKKIDSLLNDKEKFESAIYESAISIFKENNKKINPLKFIESMKNDDCNKALIRIFNNINMINIKKIFDEIPSEYNEYVIMTDSQREYYYKLLEYKYNEILKKVYYKLNNR